jgi:asparagine N-glycosylation enzyme membrane subunit Stt3
MIRKRILYTFYLFTCIAIALMQLNWNPVYRFYLYTIGIIVAYSCGSGLQQKDENHFGYAELRGVKYILPIIASGSILLFRKSFIHKDIYLLFVACVFFFVQISFLIWSGMHAFKGTKMDIKYTKYH